MSSDMEIRVFIGPFGEEELLFDCEENNVALAAIPTKGDLIFYDDEVYKVKYCLFDVDDNECAIFVRKAIEEDY